MSRHSLKSVVIALLIRLELIEGSAIIKTRHGRESSVSVGFTGSTSAVFCFFARFSVALQLLTTHRFFVVFFRSFIRYE